MKFIKNHTSIFISFIILSSIIMGCKSVKNNIVGNDRDKHGCIASAGYQYSELKKDCVRPFEITLQLFNETRTNVTSVIFSEDSVKAEVFSPEGHWILNKINDFKYQKTDKKNQTFSLLKNAKYWEFQGYENVYYSN
jgi:hypothetical protein